MLCNLKKMFAPLDPMHIIAGNSTPLEIDFCDESKGGEPISLVGARCRYVLAHFSTGEPVISKECSISYDKTSPLADKYPHISYPFTARTTLYTTETIGLSGEYIHQFILSDFRNEQQIPCEGRVIIQRSADPTVTSPAWFLDVEPGGLFASPNKIIAIRGGGGGRERIRLYYANSHTLRVAIPPYSGISFISSNESVATVENGSARAGYVTGANEGECIVTAVVTAMPELEAEIHVRVINDL